MFCGKQFQKKNQLCDVFLSHHITSYITFVLFINRIAVIIFTVQNSTIELREKDQSVGTIFYRSVQIYIHWEPNDKYKWKINVAFYCISYSFFNINFHSKNEHRFFFMNVECWAEKRWEEVAVAFSSFFLFFYFFYFLINLKSFLSHFILTI